jgi:hypothetical protein
VTDAPAIAADVTFEEAADILGDTEARSQTLREMERGAAGENP